MHGWSRLLLCLRRSLKPSARWGFIVGSADLLLHGIGHASEHARHFREALVQHRANGLAQPLALSRVPPDRVALVNYLIVHSDGLGRQLHFMMGFTGHLPVSPRRLDPNLTLNQWHDTLFRGQIEPHLASTRLVRIVKPEMVIARQREIFPDLPQSDRVDRSTHDKAIELLARFGVLRHEIVHLGDCLGHIFS